VNDISPEQQALIDMETLCISGEMPTTYLERVDQLWKAFELGQRRQGWRSNESKSYQDGYRMAVEALSAPVKGDRDRSFGACTPQPGEETHGSLHDNE
jgi:hypothetical protein